ncbi:MAG: MBOAT family protein, partial [Ruminococcus sp.]|nr:MBOAT family protein [Ruminococcus sp.]
QETTVPFMLFQMLRTFLIVLVGYVFDVAPGFRAAMRTFWLFFTDQSLKTGWSQISTLGLGKKQYLVILAGALVIFIASVIQERSKDGLTIREKLDQKPFILRFALIFVCMVAVAVFGIYGSGYSAADFVYAQF